MLYITLGLWDFGTGGTGGTVFIVIIIIFLNKFYIIVIFQPTQYIFYNFFIFDNGINIQVGVTYIFFKKFIIKKFNYYYIFK